MINILFVVLGAFVGYLYRDLKEKIKELQSKVKDEPEIGATPASYGLVKGYSNQDSDIGLVNPKTPEQLDWEYRDQISKQFTGK